MPNGDKHLLLVDDDPELREHVSAYLRDHGFQVHMAGSGEDMDRVLADQPVDLVILDLMMPGEDGLSICRRLCDDRGPAVIMVSAAGEETDRVLGLELGADDYLAKPFSPRELLARARAVLRRREPPAAAGPRRGETYVFEGFTYDPSRRQLKAPSGAIILLTVGESTLLGALLLNPQRILTREELVGPAQADAVSESRAIDLQISRLRRKLQVHGPGDLIRTQRGQGYMIDCRVDRR